MPVLIPVQKPGSKQTICTKFNDKHAKLIVKEAVAMFSKWKKNGVDPSRYDKKTYPNVASHALQSEAASAGHLDMRLVFLAQCTVLPSTSLQPCSQRPGALGTQVWPPAQAAVHGAALGAQPGRAGRRRAAAGRVRAAQLRLAALPDRQGDVSRAPRATRSCPPRRATRSAA